MGTFGWMTPAAVATTPALFALLAFNASNQLAVRRLGSKRGLAFTGTDLAMAVARLEACFKVHTAPAESFAADAGGRSYRVFLSQVTGPSADPEIEFQSLDQLQAVPESLAPSLAALAHHLQPYLAEVPYLHLGENDFIYKF